MINFIAMPYERAQLYEKMVEQKFDYTKDSIIIRIELE